MKFKYISLIFLICYGVFAAEDNIDYSNFENTLNEMHGFSKNMDSLLGLKKSDCHLRPGDISNKNCHMTNYCQILNNSPETRFIRQLPNGESILNERVYNLFNGDFKECLKSHLFKDEVAQKIDNFKKENGKTKLKEVYDINQKLLKSIKKNNETSKFALINQELISANLKDSIEKSNHGEIVPTSLQDFKTRLSQIQKKLKLKLSDETKHLLIELNLKAQSKDFTEDVSKFEKSLFPEMRIPDIFYDLDNFTDELVAGSPTKLLKNQKEFNSRAQVVFDVFSEAKTGVVDYLESLKINKSQSEVDQLQRAIERVKLVKFQTPTLNDSLRLECAKPNAFYTPSTQTITVCPQWFNSPKIFLLQTLAHEVGHSIDPCHLQFPLKIHSTAADTVVVGVFQTNINMPSIKDSETLLDFPFSEHFRPQDQSPTFLKDNPFRETITCLQDKKSIGAVLPSKQLLVEKIDAQIEIMKKNQTDNASNSTFASLVYSKEHLDEYFDRYGTCDQSFLGGNSQIQEAFADKIASEVIAQKLKNLDTKTAQNEIENYALSEIGSDGAVCEDGELTKKIKSKMQQLGCPNIFSNQTNSEKFDQGLIEGAKFNTNSHPPAVLRMDKVFMAHPEIRKILKCLDDGVKYCEK